VLISENDVTESAQDLQAAPDPGYHHEEQYSERGRLVRQCTDLGGGHNPVCGTACLRVPTGPETNDNGNSVRAKPAFAFSSQMADSDVSMESDSSSDKSDEEMDTSSDSGSSPTNQPVVPFALGQGTNAANQGIRQQNDHQANQARYGLPNMVAASSHAQPQVYMESSISFSKQVVKVTSTSPLREVIESYNINYHLYADDSQLSVAFKTNDASSIKT
ncbi:unnamed protein product, partial [Porites evermanni]